MKNVKEEMNLLVYTKIDEVTEKVDDVKQEIKKVSSLLQKLVSDKQ